MSTEIENKMIESIFKIENLYSETIKNSYAKSLKKLIQHTHTNIRNMAKIIGIPFQHIYKYAEGEIEPSLSRGEKIAKYFLMNTQDFWFYGELTDENIEDEFDQRINSYMLIGEKFESLLRDRFPKYV